MQTSKALLFNGLANVAIFAASGGLTTITLNEVGDVVNKYDRKTITSSEGTNISSLPISINHVTNFFLGGALGLALKILIEKSKKLKNVNNELSSTISKLQKLESNDLPVIEKILKDFTQKEGIRYEAHHNSNPAESIISLLDAILIHVNSSKEATRPYLEELQKLRATFAGPFIEQLQNDDNVDIATRDAAVQVLRSDKLIEYLTTTIVNALEKTGAGNRIGINVANSLEGKDLLSNEAVIALKQAVIEVMRSNEVKEALDYSVGANITEYDVAERLMEILLDKYKASLQADDPDLVELKNAIAKALKKDEVGNKLADTYTESS